MRFDEVTAMSLVAPVFGTRCRYTGYKWWVWSWSRSLDSQPWTQRYTAVTFPAEECPHPLHCTKLYCLVTRKRWKSLSIASSNQLCTLKTNYIKLQCTGKIFQGMIRVRNKFNLVLVDKPIWVTYTPWAIKTCHFVFDNNSGVSWSIFVLFVPVETGRNTLQFTYLMAWWRHNCITSHVTKVFFIQLLHQVKYVEFEDWHNFFVKNLWECENFSYRRLVKEFSTKNWKRRTLDKFLRKLLTIERIVMIDFRMCCLYVVLVLPGSVETQLGWSGKFC